MHNESMAEQVIEGTALNGDGPIFTTGESGIKMSKDEDGFKFGVRFNNKQIFVGTALIVAGVLLKRYGVRAPAVVTAQKVQDVAEQAEEAATRG